MSNYITREGMQKLQKKIRTLTEERPKILDQIEEARAQGDLSENAEYHAAREKQRNLDSDLNYLTKRISTLKIIDPSTLSKESVLFGAIVKIKETTTNEVFSYILVGVDEIYDREDGLMPVSTASPLGKAMVGKKVNEEFIVKAPMGDRFFIILEIK
jgi:transcription elongation factor GreA